MSVSEIVAKYPNDEVLQYIWRENPASLYVPYWIDHFEYLYFMSWAGAQCTVFDFGCGSGNLDHLLAKKGYKVIGYDISKGLVEIARFLAATENVTFYDEFPKDADYDRVWICHTLEHIREEEYEGIFSKFKPKKPILITVPLGHAYDGPYHIHHWTTEEALARVLDKYCKVNWVSAASVYSVLRAEVTV